MANTTINIPRPHLIMGLCLPLAVLIGYFLAEPMESSSIGVVLFVLIVLSAPLLMRWHHPILLATWNAVIIPSFIPGRPAFWMIMAAVSLTFAILSRSVSAKHPFTIVPSLTKPLVFLTAVILVTAFLTGGVGLRMLGSSTYGGKGYFYLFASVAGYFALTSQRLPPHRVGFAAAVFFLSGLTALIPNLAFLGGGAFSFLNYFFPAEAASSQAAAQYALAGTIVRLGALGPASIAVLSYLLARHGVRGILDLTRPWRLVLLLIATGACMACGYRSAMIHFAAVCVVAFCLEGLWRTPWLPVLCAAGLIGGILVLPQAEKFPPVVQRTISFLPIRIDPGVKSSADDSTYWRVEMWKRVLPQVPKYLIKGKGYALDPSDLYLAVQGASHGLDDVAGAGSSAMVGDYHNGPLSVIIPFGIFGAFGFCWLLWAGGRFLYLNCKFGEPAWRKLNTCLLALYLAKVLSFFLIFGAFYTDLAFFLGILGFSVAINGERPVPVAEQVPDEEFRFSEA